MNIRCILCNVFLVLLLGHVGAYSQEHKSSFGPVVGTYIPNVVGASLVG